MASSAEAWIIVGADGKPIAGIYGNVAVFMSREEAGRWLSPGERAERLDRDGSAGSPGQ